MNKILDLKERIQKQTRSRKPADVAELNLDGCKAESVEAVTELLEQYFNLEELTLVNVGLSSLRGFPKLPKLRKLNISDNRLVGGLNNIAACCPSLEKFVCSGNRIKDLQTLEPLKSLSSLTLLDLFDCEVTRMEDYRLKVYDYLPQLKDLDGIDKNGKETKDSDDDESGDDNESYSDEPDEENRENDAEDGEGSAEEDDEELEPTEEGNAEEEADEEIEEPSEDRKGLKRRNDDTTGSDS